MVAASFADAVFPLSVHSQKKTKRASRHKEVMFFDYIICIIHTIHSGIRSLFRTAPIYALNDKDALVFHLPFVKSGISIVLLLAATD